MLSREATWRKPVSTDSCMNPYDLEIWPPNRRHCIEYSSIIGLTLSEIISPTVLNVLKAFSSPSEALFPISATVRPSSSLLVSSLYILRKPLLVA